MAIKPLQSITFPGLPDTYKVPSTPEEIGAASMVYAQQVGSPRNFLDNSDFTNPVNQRGQTSYSSDGYCFDRWVVYKQASGDISYDSTKRCIVITAIDGSVTLYQRLSKGVLDESKDYTQAYGLSDGSIVINTDIDFSPADYDSVEGLTVEPGKTIEIIWTALYEGVYTVETLPKYQPKEHSAELMECQRYFLHIAQNSTITLFTAMAYSTTTAYVNIPTPIKMRLSNPTISYTNMALRNSQTDISITGTGDPYTFGNSIYVRLEVASGLTAGKFYMIRLNSGGLSFSADL